MTKKAGRLTRRQMQEITIKLHGASFNTHSAAPCRECGVWLLIDKRSRTNGDSDIICVECAERLTDPHSEEE